MLEPYDNSFWEKISGPGQRERKKEINAINNGHLVLWQRTQAARANIFLSITRPTCTQNNWLRCTSGDPDV